MTKEHDQLITLLATMLDINRSPWMSEEDIERKLLEKCPNLNQLINLKNQGGATALHIAAHHIADNPKLVNVLLRHEADPTIKDKNGLTALSLAIRNSNMKVVDILTPNDDQLITLLATMLDINRSPWMSEEDIERKLLEKCPNLNQLINLKNQGGATALHIAAHHIADNPKLVNVLLRHEADPTIKDKNGLTALSLAIRNSNMKVVDILTPLVSKAAESAQALRESQTTRLEGSQIPMPEGSQTPRFEGSQTPRFEGSQTPRSHRGGRSAARRQQGSRMPSLAESSTIVSSPFPASSFSSSSPSSYSTVSSSTSSLSSHSAASPFSSSSPSSHYAASPSSSSSPSSHYAASPSSSSSPSSHYAASPSSSSSFSSHSAASPFSSSSFSSHSTASPFSSSSPSSHSAANAFSSSSPSSHSAVNAFYAPSASAYSTPASQKTRPDTFFAESTDPFQLELADALKMQEAAAAATSVRFVQPPKVSDAVQAAEEQRRQNEAQVGEGAQPLESVQAPDRPPQTPRPEQGAAGGRGSGDKQKGWLSGKAR